RVGEVTPAQVPDLARVRDHIREQLKAERALAASEQAGREALAAFEKLDPAQVPEDFGSPLTISRIDPQGVAKEVADAAFDASTNSFPQYACIKGPQGFVVIRVEAAQPGKSANPVLAPLAAELGQAWGWAEEETVLETMRELAKVKKLPEVDKA